MDWNDPNLVLLVLFNFCSFLACSSAGGIISCCIFLSNLQYSQTLLLQLCPPLSPFCLCLMSPCRMRMKWRLFSVSLSVNMAMPPMPEFSSSEVSVELNVSAHKTHFEYLHSLAGLLHKYFSVNKLFFKITCDRMLCNYWGHRVLQHKDKGTHTSKRSIIKKHEPCTRTSKQRSVFDDLSLHFFSSVCRCGHTDAHLLRLQMPQ